MTVGELITELEDFLSADESDRYYYHVFVNDDYDLYDTTIDSVYYRCGEVVLQSNETDNGNWCLIIPYVIHCLEFFNKNLEVCVQVSDEDLDWEYYDTVGCYTDDEGRFVISCNSR